MEIKITELNDIKLLTDALSCLISHIGEYPDYTFRDVKRMVEIALLIESQINSQINPQHKAMSTGHQPGIISNKKPERDFVFGKSPE